MASAVAVQCRDAPFYFWEVYRIAPVMMPHWSATRWQYPLRSEIHIAGATFTEKTSRGVNFRESSSSSSSSLLGLVYAHVLCKSPHHHEWPQLPFDNSVYFSLPSSTLCRSIPSTMAAGGWYSIWLFINKREILLNSLNAHCVGRFG